MDAEVAVLAQSAGTTLVALTATDAWQHMRDGITRLRRRTRPERADTVAAEWDAGREDVLAAIATDDRETLDELRIQWQGSVRRLLVARPAAVEEPRALPDRLDLDGSAARQITRHATASGQGRVSQAGRGEEYVALLRDTVAGRRSPLGPAHPLTLRARAGPLEMLPAADVVTEEGGALLALPSECERLLGPTPR